MVDTRKIVPTEQLINLTDQTIELYEYNSGEIWRFSPVQKYVPILKGVDVPIDKAEHGKKICHYVVDTETAVQLSVAGYNMEHYAILVGKNTGRNNHQIATLVWAQDPTLQVKLYDHICGRASCF